ncbi:MAG: EAL domain-containing protein [Arcobacteraceae bacterium]
MKAINLNQIIEKSSYHTKYEAIIDVKKKEIYAYEALAKFNINETIATTDEIFRHLHQNNNLFYEIEKRNKLHQIKHAPLNYKTFVNFDADVAKTSLQQEYWDSFLEKNREKIVVEITENGSDDEKSANIMKDFSSWLKSKKIITALDDFAQEGSMFSFYIMKNSEYIKIDRSFLREIEKNPNYIYYLEGVIKTIQSNGQKTIIEGVETKEDLNLVKKLGSNYMQGYYFSHLTQIK